MRHVACDGLTWSCSAAFRIVHAPDGVYDHALDAPLAPAFPELQGPCTGCRKPPGMRIGMLNAGPCLAACSVSS
jgi:hypothetical protein